MSRSWLGLTVLVAGYTIAAGVIVAAAFLLHVILGFVAFILICAGVGKALDRVLAEDKPEEPEVYGAEEGAWEARTALQDEGISPELSAKWNESMRKAGL